MLISPGWVNLGQLKVVPEAQGGEAMVSSASMGVEGADGDDV
jgi:hypothetical protein